MGYKELVKWGIRHGLIHLKRQSVVIKYSPSLNLKEQRAKFLAQGLTQTGTVRKYKKHPDLAGLPRKEYHDMYMKLKRAGVI